MVEPETDTFVLLFRKRNTNIKWQHHAEVQRERQPLEWPLMTTLELKDYVWYALYATISPHRRTIQHCRGINNLTTWGGGGELDSLHQKIHRVHCFTAFVPQLE